MILQALKEYYDRKAADPDFGIAPLGWEWKRIPFLVVFDRDGCFVRLEDTRKKSDGKILAKPFLVPSLGEAKGNGIKANLFWENAEYFFGIPIDAKKVGSNGDKYRDRVLAQHNAFVEKIRRLSLICGSNADYASVLRFVEQDQTERITADSLWEEAVKVNQAFLMCLEGKGSVPSIPEIQQAVMDQASKVPDNSKLTRCLVTGYLDEPSRLEPDIKGVRDANPTGAHIVAVNNKISGAGNGGATPAFASFMKEQGANSPIGKKASLAYTTALNTLLANKKLQVGDATTVFWASEKCALEEEFADIFGEPQKDNPDRGVDAVERLLSSVKTGSFVHDGGDARFYVLGLSPNAARIAVRFWHEGTVSEMERRFADWFESLRIAHGAKEKEHLSLTALLLSVASYNKDRQKWKENIPPNLAGAVMRSILDGTPLPASLLPAALVRIKAGRLKDDNLERKMMYSRIKLIKALLIRNNKRKITMSLDKENQDVGYRLGRLFAVLEKIQLVANPGINATIRDKFYASASATPAAVFGNLMRLKNHHLAKLTKTVFFEGLIGEIISCIAAFPAHLSLEEQGMFAIGYYHQRQDFFTKKIDGGTTAEPDALPLQQELAL